MAFVFSRKTNRGKTWYVGYHVDGKFVRKRIGRSKTLAEKAKGDSKPGSKGAKQASSKKTILSANSSTNTCRGQRESIPNPTTNGTTSLSGISPDSSTSSFLTSASFCSCVPPLLKNTRDSDCRSTPATAADPSPSAR